MISLATVVALPAAIYAGLTRRLASKPAAFLGVTVTLAFWCATVIGAPADFVGALYALRRTP